MDITNAPPKDAEQAMNKWIAALKTLKLSLWKIKDPKLRREIEKNIDDVDHAGTE